MQFASTSNDLLRNRLDGARTGFQALLIALAILLGIGQAIAEQPVPVIEQYKLPNGLTVILAPMPAAQRVAVVTGYQVGSADEPRGRSGFAHLFEHLMFEGTNAIPDYDAAASALGADTNASTSWDDTTYYVAGAANNLPGMLRLEADRMANLANAVNQADLDNQRDIVRNEMRQNTLDRPGAAARLQALATLAGPGHAYGHATIGSLADLGAATLEDVKAFHRRYYVPANAIVAVTGKFDMEVARDLVARTLGAVPASPKPAPVEGELRLAADTRLAFLDAVESPQVVKLWNGPRDGTREDAAAFMLSFALSSDSGPLYAKLVHRDRLASAVACFWESRRLGGSFGFLAGASAGIDASRLEAGLLAALREIDAEGLTSGQLEASAISIRSYVDGATSDPLSYARLLQSMAATTGDARTWRRYFEDALSVTPEEALAALRDITATAAVTTVITPGPRSGDLPPVIVESTGVAEPITAPARGDTVIPELPELAADTIAFPKPQILAMANGVRLEIYPTADANTSGMAVILSHGTTLASGPRKGLVELAADFPARGAGTMTRAEFGLAADRAGARFSADTSDHAVIFSAASANRDFEKATQLLALALLQPRFDRREWQTQVEQRVQSLEQRLQNPAIAAARAVVKAAFPDQVPEGELLEARIIKTLDMASAEAMFATLMRPERARIQVVTALTVPEVQRVVEAAFGGWNAAGEASEAPPAVAPQFVVREITTDVPGATQAAIIMQFAAPEPLTPQAIAAEIAMQVIGGNANGRLYRRLREEKGWSYGIYGGIIDGERGHASAYGYISTSVQADRARDSLSEIYKVLADVAVRPITQNEFDAAIGDIRNGYLSSLETADSLLATMSWSAAMGFDIADLEQKLKLIERASLANVQVAAEAVARQPMITVIAGDASKLR